MTYHEKNIKKLLVKAIKLLGFNSAKSVFLENELLKVYIDIISW